MKDWKFIKVGNATNTEYKKLYDEMKDIQNEIRLLEHDRDAWQREKSENPDYNVKRQINDLNREIEKYERKLKDVEQKMAIAANVKNESIDKQEWSMFKGLMKKAEEEVGNARSKEQLLADVRELTKYIKDNPDRPCEKEKRLLGEAKEELDKRYGVIVGNKAIYDDSGRFIIGYVEKNGNGYSAYTHGITGSKSYLLDAKDEKTAEAELKDYVKAYEKRTGNADTVSEYNAEIQRLTKKAEQLRRMGQGRSAMEIEKQIEKLGKEMRELGNKKVGNAILGTLDTFKALPSWTRDEVFKNLASKSSTTVYYYGDKYLYYKDTLKNQYAKEIEEKEKEYQERKKRTGNETLGQWAKAKPRIINETKAERKFGKVMGEFEEGALKTPQGKTVTDPAQAKAIAYSEADKVDNLKRARNAMKNKK